MQDRKILKATIGALIGQSIFGFTFMFTKIALEYASPMVVIADRYIIAFLAMSVVMLMTKRSFSLKGKNVLGLIIMSLFQPTLYFIFEAFGISMTTSTFSSVMIALIPVITLICGIPMLREIPSIWQCIFTVISVSGVIIMALQGKSDGTVTPLGVLLLFGAVVSAVGYNILSRKISSDFTAFERTYAMAFIGMVSFVIITLIENVSAPLKVITPFFNRSYLLSLLFLGIAASVGAFIFINNANTHLPVAKSTSFSCVTTVVSVLAGALILKEPMNALSYISASMIIVGVLGVQLSKSKIKK